MEMLAALPLRNTSRRCALQAMLALPWLAAGPAWATKDADAELTALQAASSGDLGVYALDTGNGHAVGFNADQRFAMCSTFKLLLAAAVLAQVDAGRLRLDQPVAYGTADLVPHAPVTSAHVNQGWLSVEALCAAILEVSDNPAANLLLRLIDGPAGLTRFVRRLGDEVTRLDRIEPALNSNLPGDPRDTTTPRAMVRTIRRLLVGSTLLAASRTRLLGWLHTASTGRQRLRAGVPADWHAGDKTGSGERGAINDVAIFEPPGRAPLLVACYLSGSTLSLAELNAVHARVGAWVVRALPG